MHMIGSHMPLHDLDIQRSANLSRQIPHLFPDLSSQSRLAVLGDEHKVISQPIHCMRTFPILRHLRSVPPSLLKASPKGEGVHPSQSGTLRSQGEAFASFLEGLSDEFLAEPVAMPPGAEPATKTRFEMLLSPKEHEMHHRGQLMLLQRMIGLVPHLTRQMQERMAQHAPAKTTS